MNNERTLYITSDDDLPTICTRLEHAHSRRITLVIPLHAQHLHAFATWRMLHAYARRRGIRVHIVSTNPYFRSIARSARFTVTNKLEASQQDPPPPTRPIRSMPSAELEEENIKPGEGIDLIFSFEDKAPSLQETPPEFPVFDLPTLTFTDDDVLLPFENNNESPPLPFITDLPRRVSKPPRPLNMPRPRRTRPLSPPRLPWDDVDDEQLPPPHRPIRRRTNPLAQPIMRRPRVRRRVERRQPVSRDVISLAPIVFIGIFIVVRSIVRYMRKRSI